MIYKTYLSDTSKLLSLPETGMGYQVIEAQLTRSYITKKYVVYNSDLIIDLDDTFLRYNQLIKNRGYNSVFNESSRLNIRTESITVLSKSSITESRYLTKLLIDNKKRNSGDNGAIDNPEQHSTGEEFFTRLSAYENDKRIDFENNKLRKGTYTTTFEDYVNCVVTHDDPIDRYALPNDEAIKWAFFVRPKKNDVFQSGIVQPAFGYIGGGMEAYFKDGTSNNTYFMKKQYGDCNFKKIYGQYD